MPSRLKALLTESISPRSSLSSGKAIAEEFSFPYVLTAYVMLGEAPQIQ